MTDRSLRNSLHLFSAVTAVIFLLTSKIALANIVGSDFQSFNPTSDGLDFVTVQSARTLPRGTVLLGAFLDDAHNNLPNAIDTSGNARSVGDNEISSDIHLGFGLTDKWDFGLNVSSVLQASTSDTQVGNFFVAKGLTDLRANTKFRFSGDDLSGWALNAILDLPQIQDDPFNGGATTASYALEVVGHQTFKSFLVGYNLGYHSRKPGTAIALSPYEPIGSEWLASVAAAYHLQGSGWSLISEFFAAKPTSAPAPYSVGQMTNMEFLAGGKYAGWENLDVHTGLTTELSHGTSSPAYRIYAGLNWTFDCLWACSKATVVPPASTPARPVAAKPLAKKPAPVVSNANDTSAFDKEPTAKSENFIVANINFASGSAVVPSSFHPYLKKMAAYLLRGRPLSKLTITGHTDSLGQPLMNQDLSQRRAQAVKEFLATEGGLPARKIEAVGMGASAPIADNGSPDGRSKNRRVEFQADRE